jgi:signal transduction histidine kinase
MTTNPARKCTILFAEDDDLVRTIAEETLRSAGYQVVSVPDGQAAWEALPSVQPSLILSDVRMPRCDGFELLQRVRREPEFAATPFVIMSAKAETADQRMGMSLGADDYVTKPYLPGDLLSTIAVRLERVGMVAEAVKQQQRFLTQVLPHELRTPLTGVIGYAELLVITGQAGETLTPEELLEFGQNLQRSGQRLLRIAEDFTLWCSLETKVAALHSTVVVERRKAVFITAEILQHCSLRAAELGRGDDLRLEVATEQIEGMGEGLPRVVLHLVDNALKFSLPGTPVTLTLREQGGAYEISVRDEGRGMSDDEFAHVSVLRQFEREHFEQQGLGMGLALARSYARLNGGEFRLRRNQPERGVTVQMVLPRKGADRLPVASGA